LDLGGLEEGVVRGKKRREEVSRSDYAGHCAEPMDCLGYVA